MQHWPVLHRDIATAATAGQRKDVEYSRACTGLFIGGTEVPKAESGGTTWNNGWSKKSHVAVYFQAYIIHVHIAKSVLYLVPLVEQWIFSLLIFMLNVWLVSHIRRCSLHFWHHADVCSGLFLCRRRTSQLFSKLLIVVLLISAWTQNRWFRIA